MAPPVGRVKLPRRFRRWSGSAAASAELLRYLLDDRADFLVFAEDERDDPVLPEGWEANALLGAPNALLAAPARSPTDR